MDWTLYWFMFPVAICVATAAMASGIGGAAFFTPIFLIVFPLLGPDYPLASAVTAIGASLFTVTFGFLSGFVGYYRLGLIDLRAAWPFIAVGAPVAVAGALVAHLVDQTLLIGLYGLLMAILSVVVYRRAPPEDVLGAAGPHPTAPVTRNLTARDGRVFRYAAPRQGVGAAVTALGGFLTGMLSVGIGEVVMPQLIRRHRVPVPVALGTSVLVVIAVVAAATAAQLSALAVRGGAVAVPWHLVCYTVPGVLIGGQIGPRLQGLLPQRGVELAIVALFAIVALAMGWIVVRSLL